MGKHDLNLLGVEAYRFFLKKKPWENAQIFRFFSFDRCYSAPQASCKNLPTVAQGAHNLYMKINLSRLTMEMSKSDWAG